MPIIKFSTMELDNSYETAAILTDVSASIARNNSPMLTLGFSIGDESISAKKFDSVRSELTSAGIEPGSIVNVRLKVSAYQGNKSYVAETIAPVTLSEDEIKQLVKTPPVDPEQLVNEIVLLIKQSSGRPYDMTTLNVPDDDFSITALAVRIINTLRPSFVRSSAAKTMHHNFYGGLAYHTNRMIKAAYSLCGVYSLLNRELLVCGVALHDIGKLLELKTTDTGVATYTTDGDLFGHLLLGIEMIDKICWEQRAKGGTQYDPEQVKMIKHMIASHHGKPEFDAIRYPATPEAMALHELDMIDSRIYMYEENFAAMAPGELSEPIFGIAGDRRTSIYKNSFSNYN